MVKVIVSIRLDKPLIDQLRDIATALNWSLSEVVRYLLSVSYSMLHPYVRLSTVELCNFLVENADEDNMIPTWKLVRFIAPKAVEQIEELEKKLKEKD